jgi:uncharacterized RDD family membrane protein YckC
MQPGEVAAPQARKARFASPRVLLGLALVLCAGVAIASVDTRPRWDDTGITAGALLVAAAGGSLAGVPPWLAAALVAGPILAAELSGGLGVLIAIPFALAGAYAGAFVRRRVVGH